MPLQIQCVKNVSYIKAMELYIVWNQVHSLRLSYISNYMAGNTINTLTHTHGNYSPKGEDIYIQITEANFPSFIHRTVS